MEEIHAWNDRLDTGHEALDREHHLQIALVSALVDAIEQGRPWMAHRLVDQLAGYTAAHFTSEELLMEAARYPRLPQHREEHRELLAHLDEVRSLLGGGEVDLALPMALDLRSGLGAHIATSDRRFVERDALAPGGGIPS
jgi:hemerythrin